jgi:hypothetical protein
VSASKHEYAYQCLPRAGRSEKLPARRKASPSKLPWLITLPSFLDQLVAWLTSPTPVWLAIGVLIACGAVGWQIRLMMRRLNDHAQSIAHMDSWADDVEEAISALEDRTKPVAPTYQPLRNQPPDVRKWWQK